MTLPLTRELRISIMWLTLEKWALPIHMSDLTENKIIVEQETINNLIRGGPTLATITKTAATRTNLLAGE